VIILLGIFLVSVYLPIQNKNNLCIRLSDVNINRVNLANPPTNASLVLNGNIELGSYCGTNISDGISWETAYRIENKHFNSENASTGISIANTDAFLIISNCTLSNFEDIGIFIRNCSNIRLENNYFINNYIGITTEYGSRQIYILNNNFNSNERNGLILDGMNHIIENNTIENSRVGIYIDGAYKCNVTKNVFNNNYAGIFLINLAKWNNITQNTFANNNAGISMSFTLENYIFSNIFVDNKAGIYFGTTTDYIIGDIFNNQFRNCGVVFADANPTANLWNNTVNNKPLLFYSYQENIVIKNSNVGQIILLGCKNVTISDLTIKNATIGLQLKRCELINISSVICKENVDCGIEIQESKNVLLSDNHCEENGIGIDLSGTSNVTLDNNILTKCGIFLFHGGYLSIIESPNDPISWMGSIIIKNTNLVNGKPILLYNSEQDLHLNGDDLDPGQLILVNCRNSLIENFQLSSSTVGLQIYYSTNLMIQNNIFSNNTNFGLFSLNPQYVTISKNLFSDNGASGIYLRESDELAIGVGAYSNNINNNLIVNNGYGIELRKISTSEIYENYFSSNRYYSLYLRGNDNDIYRNIFENKINNHAYDSSSQNQWEKNYWDDYQERYPNAIAENGVWSISYEIERETSDSSPLVNPPNLAELPNFPDIYKKGGSTIPSYYFLGFISLIAVVILIKRFSTDNLSHRSSKELQTIFRGGFC
jgi:parallel beta-helix repeat protein